MRNTTYGTDFYQWTQAQAANLRAKEWLALDIDNLAEEMESLGASDRRALRSQLMRLSQHLLKWRYQTHDRGESWQRSIDDGRLQIELLIEDSRTLATSCPTPSPGPIRAPGRARRKASVCPSLPSRKRAPGRWSRCVMRTVSQMLEKEACDAKDHLGRGVHPGAGERCPNAHHALHDAGG